MKSIKAAAGAAALALMAASASAAAVDKAVSLDGGAAPLLGSLMVPDKLATGAAVLMIAGSGPTDRNGDSAIPGVKPHTLKLIADGLAERGIMSLRFDKRGIAASAAAGPAESDLRFSTYVDDAEAWAAFLKAQPGVRCVVLVGHSEGALIAVMAAKQVDPCGVVSISGAGRSADDLLRDQLAASPMPEDLRKQALDDLQVVKAGGTVTDVPPPLMSLLRPSVQPYLASWLPIDPAAEIAKVRTPVLILQGSTDLQVGVQDARRLAAAKPDAQFVVLDGVNHILKDAPADRAANLATYADPDLSLDSRVVPTIADFVVKRGGR